jgi:hypothetical protein
MDIMQLIGFLAPVIVIGITQFLKKWIASRWAPLIVFVLGGISTLIGVGPSPGGGFVDATINVAFVSGGAALAYDLFKKLRTKNSGLRTLKSIIAIFLIAGLISAGCASFESNTYKTMFTLGTAYDAAMKSALALYAQERLSAEQVSKIIEYGNAYYVAYQEACVAFEVYKAVSTEESKARLVTALAEVSKRHGDVIMYIDRLKK